MANLIEGGSIPLLDAAALQELGYAVVAHPCGSVFSAARALQEWAAHLKAHGSSVGFHERLLDLAADNALVGLQGIQAWQAEMEEG